MIMQEKAKKFKDKFAKKLQYLDWDDLCEDLHGKGEALSNTENELLAEFATEQLQIANETIEEHRKNHEILWGAVRTIKNNSTDERTLRVVKDAMEEVSFKKDRY